MEGKGCLFKKFAGIDVFDIEINASEVDRIVDVVAALEPTFGGINLEDIKAPECFYIERKLRERMNIPVFHDDQHGTAIIVAAGLINAAHLSGRNFKDIKVVVLGAGAGGLSAACAAAARGRSQQLDALGTNRMSNAELAAGRIDPRAPLSAERRARRPTRNERARGRAAPGVHRAERCRRSGDRDPERRLDAHSLASRHDRVSAR